MTSMHDQIQEHYMRTIGIKKQIEERKRALEIEKERQALARRCSQHIRLKLQVSKKAAFKRQNSFNPALFPLQDIND